MSAMLKVNRRNVLRGALGGAAVSVGLPFLDCLLDANGTAFADGAQLPVCFGTWFQGLGLQPGLWEPKIVGEKFEFGPQLQPLSAFKDRINIFSGMRVFTDGRPTQTHGTGPTVTLTGGIPRGSDSYPTIDSLVADQIGTKTRFRSIEVACDGTSASWSHRSGSAINPSESSPVALYTRIFGPEFKDPNAAEFTPDPRVMVRRSALSAVTEERNDLVKQLGAADRARLDEYFTSLREIEQQLDLELQKPAPLAACKVPGKDDEATPGSLVEDVRRNTKLFTLLLANALACGQTRVINVYAAALLMRKQGSPMTFHMYTHEESINPADGYQPNVTYFQGQGIGCFQDMLTALDNIKEGDHTLLDRILILYTTDHSYARLHTLENMPLMTAGRANGRLKTGHHIQATGDSVTRVGLTVQQIMGVPANSWGTESSQTNKTVTEIMV